MSEGMNAPLELEDPHSTAPEDEVPETERKLVETLTNEYKTARAFDRPYSNQIARDRRYASGTAGANWAVNANLLGSYIDILVSYIYARNPKVAIRPAEQTGQAAQQERQYFAKTLQIVTQRLWKDGKLKKAMKRVVRAGFSVSTGWFKAVMLFDTQKDPLIEHELNDVRDNLEKIRAAEEAILDPDTNEPIDTEAKIAQLELLVEGLEAKIEIVLRKGLAIDFISTEQMQVALDVRDVDDYLEAGWNADEIFIMKSEALEKFPRLTSQDLTSATVYYQRKPTEYANAEGTDANASERVGEIDPHGEAYQYSTNAQQGGQPMAANGKPVEFIKAIEVWDRRDVHIKTIVEGIKRWAREPMTPQFATSRFYPYFKVDFFPVDGERHAQSLTFRLSKLQDEYAGVRSSFRLTRQRSIPGTLFNSGMIEEADMKKLAAAVHDEFIGVKPKDPDVDFNRLFAPKPQPTIDPMLFETSPIIGDMEKLSGVQEALQTSQTVEKTATQAEIEQGGFAARTTSERDCVEETLNEFAQYTAELALQALTYDDVVKIAGPLAFWPEGLPIEAITALLDVDIEAGSTGRPNTAAEREAWIQIMPLIRDTLMQAYEMAPVNPQIAKGLVELVRETLSRFDDRIDLERFMPGLEAITSPTPMAGALPVPGQQPGVDPIMGQRGPGGQPIAAADGAAPPASPAAAAAAGGAGNADPLAGVVV